MPWAGVKVSRCQIVASARVTSKGAVPPRLSSRVTSANKRQESTDHSSRMSTRAFDDTNITPHAQHEPDSYSRTCDLLGRILNSGKASTA